MSNDQGNFVADENGSNEPLRKYSQKTLVIVLPGDLTVFDIGEAITSNAADENDNYNDCTKDIVLSENLEGAFQRFKTYSLFGTDYYVIRRLCLVKRREVIGSFVKSVTPFSYIPMTFFLKRETIDEL